MMSGAYISRLEINPRRRAARKYLGSPQVMHAAIESGFSASSAGERRLWRVDTLGNATWLYVVSRSRPDLTHIVEDIGRPAVDGWETKDYLPFLGRLEKDQIWGFRLTANPARFGKKQGREETQRFGHVTVQQQEDWLLNRLEGWGLCALESPSAPDDQMPVPQIQVVGREILHFGRRAVGEGSVTRQEVTLTRASFEGFVRIANADLLREVLVSGVGPAKAYGCGLMTLVRP